MRKYIVLGLTAILNLGVVSCAHESCASKEPGKMYPLDAVRLLDGPFKKAAQANREYLLAIDSDRLMAPLLREAGLEMKKPPYGNWESSGLDGHTVGHYLAGMADMIAAGEDTPDKEFRKRIDYILGEMERCQKANGDGYVGGVPGSKQLWHEATTNPGVLNSRWVPWYNVHKTYAGLRDVYNVTGSTKAKDILIGMGDWCLSIISGLSEQQMQQMLGQEHGGMNEVMADIYVITGDKKYLDAAIRFNHKSLFDPLIAGQDRLTGIHANTQMPKIVGLAYLANLTGNTDFDKGARFYWDTVTSHRCVTFGGNSVSEHFNDPADFSGMVQHREGPETCNTYNMLRLTEKLFATQPQAKYADFYERALYNHILASINPEKPGYVYFTPIRPEHYRVYSQPSECFWCCVGTGMENPGRYGQFIYAGDDKNVYVNLFIASELTVMPGFVIKQDTKFPYEPMTSLTVQSDKDREFTMLVRDPAWSKSGITVKVNGEVVKVESKPSSYIEIKRNWKNGDKVEVAFDMETSVERLPDGSNWASILYGPIVLASPTGTEDMVGLVANDSRMGHVASGPMVAMDQVHTVIASDADIVKNVVADTQAGPLHFRLKNIVEPAVADGMELIPFYSLHNSRYQMYWQMITADEINARKERLAQQEQARIAREAATLDSVAPGEQQPEVEHDYKGEGTESGIHNGRHWRHGQMIQYTLDTKGEKNVVLSVTYSGDDRGRSFDIFAGDVLLATQQLTGEKPGDFVEKQYAIPAEAIAAAKEGRLVIKFIVKQQYVGGLFDVRLMKKQTASSK